nr:NAD(P)H-binding protein [Glycomyces xiaoerkulensis]
MKLTVIGATGGIGGAILNQALAAGHEATAVVRDPAGLELDVPTVRVDLADPDHAALREAIGGADAVLSGLGPRALRLGRADAAHFMLAAVEDRRTFGRPVTVAY